MVFKFFFCGYYVEFFFFFWLKGKCKRYFPSYFCALRDPFPAPGPWTKMLGFSLHLLSASEFGAVLNPGWGILKGKKMINSLPIQWYFEFWSSSVHLHLFTLSLQIVFHVSCPCFIVVFCSRERVVCVYFIFPATFHESSLLQ